MADEKRLQEMVDAIKAENPVMSVVPRSVAPDDLTLIRKEMNSGKAYRIRGGCYGRAIIIGNSQFDGNASRALSGVEVDVKNLENLFGALKFQTEIWTNQSRKNLLRLLDDEGKRPEHKTASAFVLCVSSHGNKDIIETADGKTLKLDELTAFFDGKNCSALVGKPKLFIIDTCQGDKCTEGVPVPEQVSKSSCPRVHEKADFFGFYATVPGYRAYDDKNRGSMFIRCLTYVLSRSAYEKHLYDMTLEVKELMSLLDINKQLLAPRVDDVLSKHLYIIPRQRFQLRVTTENKTAVPVDVQDTDTVDCLYATVGLKISIPLDSLVLYYLSEPLLKRDRTLADYDVVPNSMIHVVLRGEGGVKFLS